MTKKRPFASEGHLHLPRDLAPQRPRRAVGAPPSPTPAAAGGARLQILEPAPFAEDGNTFTARILDDGLAGQDLHAADRLILVRDRAPEFGDLVALPVLGAADVLVLWKAHPDAQVLRLISDRAARALPPESVVAGVVVAVLRALPGASPGASPGGAQERGA